MWAHVWVRGQLVISLPPPCGRDPGTELRASAWQRDLYPSTSPNHTCSFFLPLFFPFVLFYFFETDYYYAAQDDLELITLLPQPE